LLKYENVLQYNYHARIFYEIILMSKELLFFDL